MPAHKKNGNTNGQRRDQVSIARDILYYLAFNGPSPRSSIIKDVGLSKRAVSELLDGFLLEHGFIEAKVIGTTRYYVITRLGFSYLSAVLLALPSSWPSRRTLAELSKRLADAGVYAQPAAHIGDGLPVNLPVDLLVEHPRRMLVYTGFNPEQGLARYYLACLVKKLTGEEVAAALPNGLADYTASMGIGRCISRITLAYHNGSIEDAARAVLGLLRGSSMQPSAAGARRVVTV